MTHSDYIGVFDSGIGGLSVANAVSELLPREKLLYVADNAHAPYGPQAPAAILQYSREITRFLLDKGCKMIVVACNTATSLAIDHLRAEFPEVPFVGLEPAIKPAARATRIGVMATAATLASARYAKLKDRYLGGGKVVIEDRCEGLVPIIEASAPGSPALHRHLHEILDPMRQRGVEAIVLGCTHYPMVKADIQAVIGSGVAVIDPSQPAARQVERMLPISIGEQELLGQKAETRAGREHDFYCSGGAGSLQRALFRLPSLNAGRRLVVPHGLK